LESTCTGQSNKTLPLVHSYTRNITRDAILAGKYANIRIHGMKGNMNPFQPVVMNPFRTAGSRVPFQNVLAVSPPAIKAAERS
jgi:hypothetical protein